MKLKTLILSAVFVAMAATAHAGDAKITGTIKFEGEVPNMNVIKMDADPKCIANNAGKEVKSQTLVMGAGQTVANVFVRIKTGLPAGKTYTAATTPVEINQHGCMYIPHVIAAMVGQPVKFLNNDGTLHNVHVMSKVNPEANMAMPAFKKETTQTFAKVEDPFMVKCDVHPWMNGYVAVMDNPYFAVSGLDGKYEISGLDAGDYEVEVWHEKLGVQTLKVTVAAAETKTQDVTLKRPETVGMLDAVMIVK